MFKQERSNRHLFSRHDNRHAHSDMGDLETYFGMVSHLSYLLPRLTSKSQMSRVSLFLLFPFQE